MTNPTKPSFIDELRALGACPDAVAWSAGYSDPASAWQACERGDWMLWICGRLSGAAESERRKQLVLCACDCARLSLPLFEKRYPGDQRLRTCIETAERWAKGDATMDELRAARAAAYAAYAAADAAYAVYAVYAAADAAADAARNRVLKQCAAIVRHHYPLPPTQGGN